MSIAKFIQTQVLIPRLKKTGVLVVYDPNKVYREVCLEFKDDPLRKIIDTSKSSIISREKALDCFQELGKSNGNLEGMLVYVPAEPPMTDEEKQNDPFSIYTVCGSMFPDGDGDEYMNICIKAKPNHATEIRRIFNENANPSFEVIDAIGNGKGWPNLQAILGMKSANEILYALMAPSEEHKTKLNSQDSWVSEAKDLFSTCLGLKLITRGKTWNSIADELWRFILFSEFVFDLPVTLPDALENVPCSKKEARPIIDGLCDRLRNDSRIQALYLDRAEAIERDLYLPQHCKDIKDLGNRDTFPFEERCFLKLALLALKENNTDKVRTIIKGHMDSVWSGKGESQVQWGLVKAALSLGEVCEDLGRQLPEHTNSMEHLVKFYVAHLREADRLQREFEQSISNYIDAHGEMGEVIESTRDQYRRLASKAQDVFIRHFEKIGWPPIGMLSNNDVFDQKVASKLSESGKKVAFFLVDALRYELGVALEKELAEDWQVEIEPAFAQLPTVTNIGMASLLPKASKDLVISKKDNKPVPVLAEKTLTNVNQRMEVLRGIYGQRFQEMTLSNFKKTKKLDGTADLLVIRSVEIDSQLESSPESTLNMIHDSLKRIRFACHKLQKMKFQNIIIATDHGFFLNTHTEAGDVCSKPSGNWVNVHDRLLMGNGSENSSNFCISSEKLGVRGDYPQISGPRGLVPYRSGVSYFHGGVSLQECLVPVLTLRLGEEKSEYRQLSVNLSYRNGAKKITTYLPVFDVVWDQKSPTIFGSDSDFEIILEAHDKKGNVVGEAKAGGPVNPATGTISLRPNDPIKVTLKMQEGYEGSFVVKTMDPNTLKTYAKIDLKTDYNI